MCTPHMIKMKEKKMVRTATFARCYPSKQLECLLLLPHYSSIPNGVALMLPAQRIARREKRQSAGHGS